MDTTTRTIISVITAASLIGGFLSGRAYEAGKRETPTLAYRVSDVRADIYFPPSITQHHTAKQINSTVDLAMRNAVGNLLLSGPAYELAIMADRLCVEEKVDLLFGE